MYRLLAFCLLVVLIFQLVLVDASYAQRRYTKKANIQYGSFIPLDLFGGELRSLLGIRGNLLGCYVIDDVGVLAVTSSQRWNRSNSEDTIVVNILNIKAVRALYGELSELRSSALGRSFVRLFRLFKKCKDSAEAINPSPSPSPSPDQSQSPSPTPEGNNSPTPTPTPSISASPTPSPSPSSSPTPSPSRSPSPSPTPSPSRSPSPSPSRTPTPIPSSSPTPTPPPSFYTLSATPRPNPLTAQNTLRVANLTSGIVNNQPVEIGRAFVQGEIPRCPVVQVNGVNGNFQVVVKNRWSDGSVKFAVIHGIMPSLGSRESRTLSFRDSACPGAPAAFTVANMLESRFNLDARIQLSKPGHVAQSLSLRAILTGANPTTHIQEWANGPIAYSAVIADHSGNRDLGFEANRSFRGLFYVTFWKTINKVTIDIMGENGKTSAVQNIFYDVDLILGQQNPQNIYSRQAINHRPHSSWVRSGNIGSGIVKLFIDHNLSYLIRTRTVANFALDNFPREQAVSSMYEGWLRSARELLQPGFWTIYEPASGGRGDLGIYNDWASSLLHTWDLRAFEVVEGLGFLSFGTPRVCREADSSRYFDHLRTVSGFGKFCTIHGRPTLVGLEGAANRGTQARDLLVRFGQLDYQGWVADTAHQPEPFHVLYLVTGRRIFLDGLQMRSAWGMFDSTVERVSLSRGTGEHLGQEGEGGAIGEIQTRGWAWKFYTRMLSAFFSVDGTPEKTYFERLTQEAIAEAEAARGLPLSNPAYPNMYRRGQENRSGVPAFYGGPTWGSPGPFSNGFNFWDPGVEPRGFEIVHSDVSTINLHWQQYYVDSVLLRASELGFPTRALLNWSGLFSVKIFQDPASNRYMLGQYYIPERRSFNGVVRNLNDFPSILAGYTPSALAGLADNFSSQWHDVQHGYPVLAKLAAAGYTQIPGGSDLFNWLSQQAYGSTWFVSAVQDNPKNQLLPRP